MYVAPRPEVADDPHFALRVSLLPAIGFIIGGLLNSPLAMIFPVLMFSLVAGNRKAFNLGRTIAAPIMFTGTLWLMSGLVLMLQGTPGLLLAALFLVYFLAFFLIQRTGNGFGMLIAVSAILMGVMGLGSYQAMSYLRSEMGKAALMTILVAPVLYALIPPRTKELMVDVYTPAEGGQHALRAGIRAAVVLVATVLLSTIIDFSNMMLAIAALYVLVFPTRQTIWREAGQRSFSVVLGGAVGLAILALLTVSAHLAVLLIAVTVATWWFADRMMHGRLPPMAYQDAASVMISLVGTALATSEPSFAFIQRAGLTILGTVVAAFAISLLEALLLRPAPTPQAA